MKKINLRKGAGEYIAFCVIAPLICSVVIMLCAFIQLSICIRELANATTVTGRSVSVCATMDDALIQSQRVAESAFSSENISNIRTTVEYATADNEWKTGVLVKVTVYADIDTVAPFITDGTRKKTTIISIEGEAMTDDVNLLAATIATESSPSNPEGMMAVGTIIMNRIDSPLYPNNLHDVIYQPMQFEVTWVSANFDNYVKNGAPEEAITCARDILRGSRTPILEQHNCTQFRTHLPVYEHTFPNGIDIGGNWFFW